LYLGSSSEGRKELLRNSLIDFECVDHGFDEKEILLNANTIEDAKEVTKKVTVGKLNSLINFFFDLKNQNIHKTYAVLVADTLVFDCMQNKLLGKPQSIDEFCNNFLLPAATLHKLKVISVFGFVGIHDKSIIQSDICVDVASVIVKIDEDDLYNYCRVVGDKIFMVSSGFSIEGFGEQFIVSVNGSPSTIKGLPLKKFLTVFKKWKKIVDKKR